MPIAYCTSQLATMRECAAYVTFYGVISFRDECVFSVVGNIATACSIIGAVIMNVTIFTFFWHNNFQLSSLPVFVSKTEDSFLFYGVVA